MKIKLLFLSLLISCIGYSQTNINDFADSTFISPDSLCLTCSGAIWHNPHNALITSAGASRTLLMPKNICNQSNCYYSREFRFCNYGFTVPLNATIDSMYIKMVQGTSAQNSVVDTVVQLLKNYSPVGNNQAYPYLWLMSQGVYYPTGLYGTTWTPQEINDPGFGMMIRVKNVSTDTITVNIGDLGITVFYSISNGVFSQTAEQNLLNVFPNPAIETVSLTLNNVQGKKLQLKITDVLGRIVYSENVESSSVIFNKTIDIAALAKGVYSILINDNEGGVYSQKVVKE